MMNAGIITACLRSAFEAMRSKAVSHIGRFLTLIPSTSRVIDSGGICWVLAL